MPVGTRYQDAVATIRAMIRRPALAAAVLLVTALATGCGEDGGEADISGASGTEEDSCEYVEDGSQPARDVTPPPAEPTTTGTVEVTIKTSEGDLAATLDADSTPCTVNNFVSLAEQDFYDDTQCHRLTTEGIYVLQCGDPLANGTGGPGYTIPDEVTGEETYPQGTLAMAKTMAPDSGGSQFFIVYQDTPLPPDYTVFGTLDPASVKVVQEIAARGTETGETDGAPKVPVTITDVATG